MEQQLSWRKSSYSGTTNGANCVEAALVPGGIAVRDSKDKTGCDLRFKQAAWNALSSKLKTSTFSF